MLVTAEPSAGATTGPINLLAGQSADVGDVTVQSDGTRVRLLTRTDGACIAGLHAAVAGSPQLIPQTKRGNAIPGRFPIAREYTPCTTEAEVFVPLSGIPGYVPGQPIYVAVHADVVMPTGETDSAWAEGTGFPGANWSSYTDVALLPTVLTFDEVTAGRRRRAARRRRLRRTGMGPGRHLQPQRCVGVRGQVRVEPRLHRRGIDVRGGGLPVTGRLARTDRG